MRILDKNRANYKRTFSDKVECIFCGEDDILECSGLAGKYWRVLVNRFPYMDGNVMILPQRHIEKVENITPEEWQEFGVVLTETQQVLSRVFKVTSFNVGLNVGPESGASIPHLHWQVIPRKFKNITVANTFADLHIVAVTPEETKERIDKALKRAEHE
jgi:ATP adenylyltransferase